MVKFLKHTKSVITVLIVVVISLGNATAVDNPGTAVNTVGKEIVNSKSNNALNEDSKKSVVKKDSTKSVNQTTAQAKKATKGNSEVKKSNNASPSIFSYNFVFYLMYKFKIADILNISKENNKVFVLPDESSVLVKGKTLLLKLIYRISP